MYYHTPLCWHLLCMVLSPFNFGKFDSEIAYGSVITFWLLPHIVNLIFACLYYLGRPAYRQSERFAMTNDITVTDTTQTYLSLHMTFQKQVYLCC